MTVIAPAFEPEGHRHVRQLTRRELIRHLAVPHRRPDGSWISLASKPTGWNMRELQRTHEEYHA